MLGTAPLGGRALGGSPSGFGSAVIVVGDTHDGGYNRRYLEWWERKRQEVRDRDRPKPPEPFIPELTPLPVAFDTRRLASALTPDPEEDEIMAIIYHLEDA